MHNVHKLCKKAKHEVLGNLLELGALVRLDIAYFDSLKRFRLFNHHFTHILHNWLCIIGMVYVLMVYVLMSGRARLHNWLCMIKVLQALVGNNKFSSEFGEPFQIWSSISTDGKTKTKIWSTQVRFSKFDETKNSTFCMENIGKYRKNGIFWSVMSQKSRSFLQNYFEFCFQRA